MNCKNCGNLIPDDAVTCPKCGFDNSASPEMEEVINQVAADTVAPELEMDSEDLTKNSMDISNADVETYDQVETEVKKERVESTIQDSIDLAIPSAVEPDKNDTEPVDGVATINSNGQTLGAVTTEDTKLSKFKIKFKKGGKVSNTVMLVGVAAALVFGVVIGASLFSKNYCTQTRRFNETNKLPVVADGANNTTQLNSFTMTIPKKFLYDKKNNGMLVYNDDDSFRIYLRPEKKNYDDLSASKVSLKATLASQSFTVSDLKEMKINNHIYLIIEGLYETQNRLIAFTKFDDNYLFFIEIVNNDNGFDYDALNVCDDIITNAKFNEDVSNIEQKEIYDIYDILSMTIDEHKKRLVSTN